MIKRRYIQGRLVPGEYSIINDTEFPNVLRDFILSMGNFY